MLQQSAAVRRSYAEEVLEATGPGAAPRAGALDAAPAADGAPELRRGRSSSSQRPRPRQEIWMLRQNDGVRQSYVRDVLRADGEA